MKTELQPLSGGEQILYFNRLRFFAVIGIIVLHLSANDWTVTDVSTSQWAMLDFYNSLVRWCVPIFIMLSGTLFLNREEIPLKKLYGKYILRLAVAYIVWSFVYFLFDADSISSQFLSLFQTGKSSV